MPNSNEQKRQYLTNDRCWIIQQMSRCVRMSVNLLYNNAMENGEAWNFTQAKAITSPSMAIRQWRNVRTNKTTKNEQQPILSGWLFNLLLLLHSQISTLIAKICANFIQWNTIDERYLEYKTILCDEEKKYDVEDIHYYDKERERGGKQFWLEYCILMMNSSRSKQKTKITQ